MQQYDLMKLLILLILKQQHFEMRPFLIYYVDVMHVINQLNF